MKKVILILMLPIILVSCCWIPDTTCYPTLIYQEQANKIRYMASCCDYYNYGYVKYVKNKNKPKRLCYLTLFVDSDKDYRLSSKDIYVETDKSRIRKRKYMFGACKKNIFAGVNMVSVPLKTRLFSNDTICVVIRNNDGDTLMRSTILADESMSREFQLLGVDTTCIDSVWQASIKNMELHGKPTKGM